MSKNKITYEHYYDFDEHLEKHIFTGSQRQPTLIEVNNWCVDNGINIAGAITSFMIVGNGWLPPEDFRQIKLIEYDFNSENCPLCNHARDFYSDNCPTCGTPWLIANEKAWEKK